MLAVLIATVLAATPPLPDMLPDCLPDITITEIAVGHGNNVLIDARDVMIDIDDVTPPVVPKPKQVLVVKPPVSNCPGGNCQKPTPTYQPRSLFRRWRYGAL